MSEDAPEAAASQYGRTTRLLTVAYGCAGALTYAFFAVASHNLSAADYGAIAALWTAVFFTFSTLCRPIESFLSRGIAEAEALSHGRRAVVIAAARIQLALATLFVAGALIARDSLQEGLFEGDALLFWAFVIAVLGFGAGFFARGYLAGRQLFGLYAALLVFEGGTRIVCALAVALGLSEGRDLAAVAIAAAPFGSLIPVGLALLGRRRGGPSSRGTAPARPRLVATFTLSVVVIMLGEQALISLGPLLVREAEGAAMTGFIFNEMVLAIGPLLLFQAVLTTLLPHLTRLRSQAGAEFDRSVRQTLEAVAVFSALALAVVAAVGPAAMQLAFGDNFTYGRTGLLIVTLGMGFYLTATTLNQAALARGLATAAATRWALCTAGFLAWNLLAPLDQVRAVETGFAGAAASLALLLALLHARRAPGAARA